MVKTNWQCYYIMVTLYGDPVPLSVRVVVYGTQKKLVLVMLKARTQPHGKKLA